MADANYRAAKIPLFKKILKMLGISKDVSPARPPSLSITETIRRMDKMEDRVQKIEEVTLSWTAADMSEEQMREMGIIE